MKAYILKEEDFERLRLQMEALEGRQSKYQSQDIQHQISEIYRLFKYHVECWIDEVQK